MKASLGGCAGHEWRIYCDCLGDKYMRRGEDGLSQNLNEAESHTPSGTSAEFLPAAGVLVEESAGKALVMTSSSKNPPSLLSTAHMDPGEVWQNK